MFKTTLDGGATELFAIGRYLDTVSLDGGAPRLAKRVVRLETRSSASAITFRSERRIPCAFSSTPAIAPTTSRRTPGARILYAGLAAGINLPYECGSGTCGTCKARLIAGEIDDLLAARRPGRKYLKQPGEFLMCQCVARNDCTVEVASFVYNMDPGRVHSRRSAPARSGTRKR